LGKDLSKTVFLGEERITRRRVGDTQERARFQIVLSEPLDFNLTGELWDPL
jgi:hypothetical protein